MNRYHQILVVAAVLCCLIAVAPSRPSLASQPVLSAGFYPIESPVAGKMVIAGGAADGSVAVGMVTSGNDRQMFLWDPINGSHIVPLPTNNELWEVDDMSADGKVVVGQISERPFGTRQAFRWTQAGGFEELGTLSPDSFDISYASSVSGDGSVIVGLSEVPGGVGAEHAFRWMSGTGMVDLGTLGTSNSIHAPWSAASRVSDDGTIIVGTTTVVGQNSGQMALWTSTSGWIVLGSLPEPPRGSGAAAMTPDGSIVVGYDQGNGFDAIIWSQADGLRALPRHAGYTTVEATQITADGSFIIGVLNDATAAQAVAYSKRNGVYVPELLTGVLIRQGLDLVGGTISGVASMSPDGRVLVGMAFDKSGVQRGFVALLPVPERPTLGLLVIGGCGVLVLIRREQGKNYR